MAFKLSLLVLLLNFSVFLKLGFCDDPTVSYDFKITYITASPLGVPQQVFFFSFFLWTDPITMLFAFRFDFVLKYVAV